MWIWPAKMRIEPTKVEISPCENVVFEKFNPCE
jgi:hypothetical protein